MLTHTGLTFDLSDSIHQSIVTVKCNMIMWWVTLWFPPLLCTETLVLAVIQRSGTKLTFKTDQEERITVLLGSEDLCGSPGAAQEILNRSSTLTQEAARILSSLHSDLKHLHSSFTRTRWLATHIKSRPAGPLLSLHWVMELIKQTLPSTTEVQSAFSCSKIRAQFAVFNLLNSAWTCWRSAHCSFHLLPPETPRGQNSFTAQMSSRSNKVCKGY